MAIRTKKYKNVDPTGEIRYVRAIEVKESNVEEIAAYINRNGGAATARGQRLFEGRLRPARIRLKQLNFGENWGKRDWRVATLGDWIVKNEGGEFFRMKPGVFHSELSPA